MISLNLINVVMVTDEISKPAPSTWPSINLQGKQIHMSGLDTAHWQFYNAPEEKFQDQRTLIQ